MAAPINQKEYLKKYLGGADTEKKKKKKKKDKLSSHSKGMRIVEDSLDLKCVPFGYIDEDDNPTVAEITYEDEKIKAMEEYVDNKKWKKVKEDNKEDDTFSWLHVHPHRSDSDSTPREGSESPLRRPKCDDSHLKSGKKSFPSSPRKGKDESLSPPRKGKSDSGSGSRKQKSNSGSPQRKLRHDSLSPSPSKIKCDSDSSPRRSQHDSDSPSTKVRHTARSPMRKGKDDPQSSQGKQRHGNKGSRKQADSFGHSMDADEGRKMLPPKRSKRDSSSPYTKRQHCNSTSSSERYASSSPQPERAGHDSRNTSQIDDKDLSPPRKSLPTSKNGSDSSISSPGSLTSDSNSVKSKEFPVSSVKGKQDSKISQSKKPESSTKSSPIMKRKSYSDSDDSDPSPPRKGKSDCINSPPRRKRHDSDPPSPLRKRNIASNPSPPRRREHSNPSPPRKREHSNLSPLRRRDHSNPSPPRRRDYSNPLPPRRREHSNQSPIRKKKYDSDSSPVRHDFDSSPPRKYESLRKGQWPEKIMTTKEFLSARKHGKLKKDTPEEIAKKQREAVLQREAEEKHQQWKHGVKQVQEYKQKLADDTHEMSKSFSRSADDVDMNKQLKSLHRKEDPMLEYVMKKEARASNQEMKPLFKGSFPPNRLDIRPGYRWDGVNRSSGFEKRWFDHQNNKRAVAEDSYKWSVSEM